MNKRLILAGIAVLLPVLALAAGLHGLALAQGPLGSGFTYQGQLLDDGSPITDTCAMAFSLYDAASLGAQVGSTITPSVAVTNGLFTVPLDFGSAVFGGEARWLGIRVDCGGGYADLGRQALSAAPYALYAASTGALRGRAVSAAAPAAGQVLKWNGGAWSPAADDDTTYKPGFGLDLDEVEFFVVTSTIQQRVGGTCTAGNAMRAIAADGTVTCQAVGGAGWSLAGNAGTTPGTNFLGTTDNQALELKVNNARALRLAPNATSPNLIGGYSGNWVSPTVVGAAIGGGGSSGALNQVTANYGTVSGGGANQANGQYASIGGGDHNEASGNHATVGGGYQNKAVTGLYTTIGGGSSNQANASWATVGGGDHNQAITGTYTVVGGGYGNQASGNYAVVGGGASNQASADTYPTVGGGFNNQASGNYAVVGGGAGNQASAGTYTTVGGGYANLASAMAASVGGGQSNQASASYAAVGGGQGNRAVTGTHTTVAGGYENQASGNYAAVGGGYQNKASGDRATVGGGWNNQASNGYAVVGGGGQNLANGNVATVGGGSFNQASSDYAVVGGGYNNWSITGTATVVGGGVGNQASGNYATVSGGRSNQASAISATVSGGAENTASAMAASVAGGYQNLANGDGAAIGGGAANQSTSWYTTVGGGAANQAGGSYATVGGGYNDSASGNFATVPGGASNIAGGDYSFAAGWGARANSDGCFVWNDSAGGVTPCDTANAFVARTSGGATFYTSAARDMGVVLPAGGGGWAPVSDRALKANVVAADGGDVLARLAQVPVSTWNYTSQDPSIRHMGPMAQDFYAAFGLGEDDKHIGTVDADGVALAAIQGLYAQNQSLAAENAALKTENAAQQQALDDLQKRMAAMEAVVNGGGR